MGLGSDQKLQYGEHSLGMAKRVYAAGSIVASVERELRKDITRGVPRCGDGGAAVDPRLK